MVDACALDQSLTDRLVLIAAYALVLGEAFLPSCSKILISVAETDPHHFVVPVPKLEPYQNDAAPQQ
jgi:hypothetical protein